MAEIPPKIEKNLNSFVFEEGSFTDKGNKTENQDRAVFFPDLSVFCDPKTDFPFRKHSYIFSGVYDGHSGETTCEYLKERLHIVIAEELVATKDFSVDNDVESKEHIEYIKNVLVNSFHRVDNEILQNLRSSGENDGSTAVVCLVVDNVAWVANVGDSKALIARKLQNGALRVRKLSKDHNPTHLEERRRVEKKGGFVKEGRVLSKLAVSRSFGDTTFKQYGVIASPYISRVVLNTSLDVFILLGCDGLWSRMSEKESAEIALKGFSHFSKPSSKETCRKLVKEAVIDRNSSDNVTALLLKIAK